MRNMDTFIALNRFGSGMNADDIANAQGIPRDWVKAQISPRFLRPPALTALPNAVDILGDFYESRSSTKGGTPERKAGDLKRRKDFSAASLERLLHKVTTPAPVVERFTQFWANHFTVSRTRGLLGPAIPAYETHAIRPHIFSKFEDILMAAVTHPCMLIYLDNISSVGPNSKQGRNRRKDLNENLAREVMELHTLGAGGGYSQEDIIEFAKVLTGWTVTKKRRGGGGKKKKRNRKNAGNNAIGGTSFESNTHEPGEKTILGKTYPAAQGKELVAVLRDLAVHPSTAKFIATKLARHFISDTPKAADIDVLAKVFRDTGGDLREVSMALVDLDSVWETPMPKVKTPEELMISVMRADSSKTKLKRKLKTAKVGQSLKSMGQDTFRAPSPAGWPDEAARWLSPESLVHRIEWVRAYASNMGPNVNPDDLFEATIAPVADDRVRRMIKGAPSREDAIALIFASSAFQRR